MAIIIIIYNIYYDCYDSIICMWAAIVMYNINFYYDKIVPIYSYDHIIYILLLYDNNIIIKNILFKKKYDSTYLILWSLKHYNDMLLIAY